MVHGPTILDSATPDGNIISHMLHVSHTFAAALPPEWALQILGCEEPCDLNLPQKALYELTHKVIHAKRIGKINIRTNTEEIYLRQMAPVYAAAARC